MVQKTYDAKTRYVARLPRNERMRQAGKVRAYPPASTVRNDAEKTQ